MFRYEDMVDKKFEALNAYFGFETEADAEVPSGTGKEKVVRKKAYGDWRHWYTADDVMLNQPTHHTWKPLAIIVIIGKSVISR